MADHLPILARDSLVADIIVNEAATRLGDSQLLDHDGAVFICKCQSIKSLYRHICNVATPLRLDRMETYRNVPLRKYLKELLLFAVISSRLLMLGFSVTKEPDPVGAAEDDLLNEHILQGERLHVPAADLGAPLVTHQGEPNLAPIVLNIHLGEAMVLWRFWGICRRHISPMNHRLETYGVTWFHNKTAILATT